MIAVANYAKNLHVYLDGLGNQDIAQKQSQYMRNQFPFFGLMKDQQDKYWKEFQAENGKISANNAIEFCNQCIQYSEREMWYIGMKTLILYKKKLKGEDLQFIESLIVKADWWDIVDSVASHLIGALCMNFPELRKNVDHWIEHENFWLRRTALIYQLGYKKNTDEKTLYSHILKTCHEQEFFIRKAIGWALREYSKYNKESVRLFIETHGDILSNLSKKEGSKYL